jgi:hypothetical protein
MEVFGFLAFRFADQPAEEKIQGDSPAPFN